MTPEPIEPPPIVVPPSVEAPPVYFETFQKSESPPNSGFAKKAGPFAVAMAAIAAKAKAFFSILITFLKFAKLGKVLLTAGSMVVSVAFYARAFGWQFGLGFVLLILIHEMGHVFVAWRQGLPITAPIFIPGMGAIILQKRFAGSVWAQAIMGIGGPVGGTFGALACWGIYAATGQKFYMALAFMGFFMNLFNLLPIPPLDGGWITGAVSPILWVLGLSAFVVLLAVGWIRNPMAIILVVLSLPRLWTAWTQRNNPEYRATLPPVHQRLIMGTCYLGLAAFLALGMSISHEIITPDVPHHNVNGQLA